MEFECFSDDMTDESCSIIQDQKRSWNLISNLDISKLTQWGKIITKIALWNTYLYIINLDFQCISKVIYPKYSRHWLSTLAHTIDCMYVSKQYNLEKYVVHRYINWNRILLQKKVHKIVSQHQRIEKYFFFHFVFFKPTGHCLPGM